MFGWFRKRARKKILAGPFPVEWGDALLRHAGFVRDLPGEAREKLFRDMRVFVAEKQWEGCGGLDLTEAMRVTIAARACRLVIGRSVDDLDGVESILVYPRVYVVREEHHPEDGLVHEVADERTGEAHPGGAVVLAWAEIEEDMDHPEDARDLVLHEMAHQLDLTNGVFDGTPDLEGTVAPERWRAVMTRAFRELQGAAERDEDTLIDPYGATDEGEFFAVATECFFLDPVALRATDPDLYLCLREYYRQDPIGRAPDDRR